MLVNPTISVLLFILSALVCAQPNKPDDRDDNRRIDSRSTHMRRVLDNNSMRFGKKSDLPPLFNRMQYDDEDEDFFARIGRQLPNGDNNMNHMRPGRGTNDNHMRFGRTDNFMRFGRNPNFMRFGRNIRYKRGSDGRRPSDSFMRFGRDYEEEIEADEEVNDNDLAILSSEIACKMNNVNCDSQFDTL